MHIRATKCSSELCRAFEVKAVYPKAWDATLAAAPDTTPLCLWPPHSTNPNLFLLLKRMHWSRFQCQIKFPVPPLPSGNRGKSSRGGQDAAGNLCYILPCGGRKEEGQDEAECILCWRGTRRRKKSHEVFGERKAMRCVENKEPWIIRRVKSHEVWAMLERDGVDKKEPWGALDRKRRDICGKGRDSRKL